MKKLLYIAVLVASVGAIAGCGSNKSLIRDTGISSRNDVFQEAAGRVPEGYANLRISLSLKTHGADVYSESDRHGTPDYKLLVNIDGQAVEVKGSLQQEDRGGITKDPEAGRGTRYYFHKELRLRPGKHRITVALPADHIALMEDVELRGGDNFLTLTPKYGQVREKRRPGFYTKTSFKEGVRGIEAALNTAD